MEINVDLTNIPEGPEALPQGEYLCQVNKIEMKDSKNTPGNKNLEVEYTVLKNINDLNLEVSGRKTFDTLSLSQAALWRLRDWIQACGVFPGPQGFKTEEVIGAQVIVGLVQEQRMTRDQVTGALTPVTGKMRNKVAGYRSATA